LRAAVGKYVTLIILVLVIGLPAAYWSLVGNPFKRPVGAETDEVAATLAVVREAIRREDWSTAREHVRRLRRHFDRVRIRLHLVADHAEFLSFERELDQLEAAIDIQDLAEAYLIVTKLESLWRQLGEPYP